MIDDSVIDWDKDTNGMTVCVLFTKESEEDGVFNTYRDWVKGTPSEIVQYIDMIEFWELVSSNNVSLDLLEMMRKDLSGSERYEHAGVIRDVIKMFHS